MGLIQKPYRGAVLNRTHPLARGLTLCAVFNEHGLPFDYADQRLASSMTATATAGGLNFKGDGGDKALVDFGAKRNQSIASGLSVFVKGYRYSNADLHNTLVSNRNGSNQGYTIGTYDTGTGGGNFFVTHQGVAEYTQTAVVLWTNRVASWGISHAGPNTYFRTFLDGIFVEQTSVGSYNAPASTDSLLIGCQGPAPGADYQGYHGIIHCVYVWDRPLPDAAFARLNSNPYLFFDQPSRAKYFFVSAAATLDLEGFRFRNDDGSESAATWKASQDTNITLAADTAARLRLLVNATGDPAGKQFQLEYRHKPSGGSFGPWKRVLNPQ